MNAHAHPGPLHDQHAIPIMYFPAVRQLQDLLGPVGLQQAVLSVHGKEDCLRHRGECDVERVSLRVDLVTPVAGDVLTDDLQAPAFDAASGPTEKTFF